MVNRSQEAAPVGGRPSFVPPQPTPSYSQSITPQNPPKRQFISQTPIPLVIPHHTAQARVPQSQPDLPRIAPHREVGRRSDIEGEDDFDYSSSSSSSSSRSSSPGTSESSSYESGRRRHRRHGKHHHRRRYESDSSDVTDELMRSSMNAVSMEKTITQQSKELNSKLANIQSKISSLDEMIRETTAQLNEIKSMKKGNSSHHHYH